MIPQDLGFRTPIDHREISGTPRRNSAGLLTPACQGCRLDASAPARQTDHGRDQEQHDSNKEDDLGDFDGGSGDAAKAQDAGDQGDDQKRNDLTQHDTDLRFPRFGSSNSATMSASVAEPIRLRNECS